MMTIQLGINLTPFETIGVINRGPVVGEPGVYAYDWDSSKGFSGKVTHRRDDGAERLAAAVMIDRITRQPGEDHVFNLEGIEQSSEDGEVVVGVEAPDAG